jgi:iron complex transport system substrate-binding protein
VRRSRLLPTLLVVIVALAGCGGDDDSEAADNPQPNADGSEPVTIEHKYGTTTLESTPQRVVSLDTAWTDVLTELDAPLVGAGLDPAVEGGIFPWQPTLPESVERIRATDSIPYEAVAALRPDLIVITYFATEASQYERLRAIAPTIPLLGDEEVDRWQDIATAAGRILGREAEAQALVDESAALAAEVADELPGLEGKTYALANYVPGDAIYVVADPDDGASELFGQLGLAIDPELLVIADGASGRVELSLERVDELDADLLVLLTNGADPETIPGYASLPAVQDGAVAILDVADVSGLNTPTPLSVPYCLDLIRQALEAAAT